MDAGFVAEDGRIEYRLGDAAALLVKVVSQCDADAFAEAGNRVEVGQAQKAHEEVGQVPDQREFCDAAEEYHGDAEEAENVQGRLGFLLEEGDVDFAIVVVAADGAEGKHHDHDGDANRCQGAEEAGKRCLRERGTGYLAADDILAREQDDESGSGADEPGIDIDAEGLDKTLFYRMGNVSRSGRIRYGAFAGLVGEQAALDAREDGRAETTADCSLRGERIVDNQGKHARDFIEVEEDNGNGRQDVETGHDGNQELREFGDAGHAAEDDKCREDTENDGRAELRDAEGILHGQCDGVGLYGVIDKTVGNGDEDSEELSDARLLEGILDVVSRAAMEGIVAAWQLVDLGQRALDEAGSAADEGDNPHPEDSTRAAGNDCDSHTGNVADTDTGGSRDAECLEGADGFARCLFADAIRQQADHFRQQAQLDKFCRQREPKAAADKDSNEDIGPKDIIDLIDDSV